MRSFAARGNEKFPADNAIRTLGRNSMTINAMNGLSFLATQDMPSLINGQSPASGDAGSATAFSASLMQQLTALQSQLASGQTPDPTAVQTLMDLGGIGGAWPAGQAITAGPNQSPDGLTQDMPLDAAMQALADLLQSVPPDDVVDDTALADSEALTDEQALGTEQSVPTVVATPVIPQPLASETRPVLADVPIASSANRQATAVQSAPMAKLEDELENELERSFGALLLKTDGNSDVRTGKPVSALMGGDDVLTTRDTAPEAVATTEKPLASSIAGDIARMSQSLRGTTPSHEVAIGRPFNDPAWNQELGEKLVWMHKQAVPSAELRLNPEHLGPISIRVDVQGDQASIAFSTHHPAVKDAIEAALPKLRDMLQEQQLNLVDVNVAQQDSDPRQNRAFLQMAADQGRHGFSPDNPASDDAANPSQTLIDEIESGRAIASNGLLSLYA